MMDSVFGINGFLEMPSSRILLFAIRFGIPFLTTTVLLESRLSKHRIQSSIWFCKFAIFYIENLYLKRTLFRRRGAPRFAPATAALTKLSLFTMGSGPLVQGTTLVPKSTVSFRNNTCCNSLLTPTQFCVFPYSTKHYELCSAPRARQPAKRLN